MKLNCIIVDDEPIARKVLEEYIDDINFLQVGGTAAHPPNAVVLFNSQQFDLMFLDIDMPKMNGLDFLRTVSVLPPTIMTTAYAEYAVEGFDLDVLDYLVKPFSFERFLKAANKAKEYIALKVRKDESAILVPAMDFFFVKCNGHIEKVHYDELVYIEARQNYIVLHTEDRKLLVYMTMKRIAEQLPEHLFLKIHKSTIINITKVKSIAGNEVNIGKAKVLISQAMHDDVIKVILAGRMLNRQV